MRGPFGPFSLTMLRLFACQTFASFSPAFYLIYPPLKRQLGLGRVPAALTAPVLVPVRLLLSLVSVPFFFGMPSEVDVHMSTSGNGHG